MGDASSNERLAAHFSPLFRDGTILFEHMEDMQVEGDDYVVCSVAPLEITENQYRGYLEIFDDFDLEACRHRHSTDAVFVSISEAISAAKLAIPLALEQWVRYPKDQFPEMYSEQE